MKRTEGSKEFISIYDYVKNKYTWTNYDTKIDRTKKKTANAISVEKEM